MSNLVLLNSVGQHFAGDKLDSVQDSAVIAFLESAGGVLIPYTTALDDVIDRITSMRRKGCSAEDATSVMMAVVMSLSAVTAADPALAAAQAVTAGTLFNVVCLVPLQSGADDWIRLRSVMVACAYKWPIYLCAGLWRCASAQLIPSGTRLIGSSGVRIVQRLALGTGSPLIAAFVAAESAGSFSTTLAGNAVIGSQTLALTSTTGLTEGSTIKVIESVYRAVMFKVVGIAGTTVFVDRPIQNALLAGNAVATVVPSEDIRVFGNGMSISGIGSRYIEPINCRNCLFDDILLDGQDGLVDERFGSIDMADHKVVFSRVRGTCTRTGLALHAQFAAGAAIDTTAGIATLEPCYCVRIVRGGVGVATTYTIDGLDYNGAVQQEVLTSSGATTIVGSKQWSAITRIRSNVNPQCTTDLQTQSPVTIGLSFESADSCDMIDCESIGAGVNILLQDAMSCTVRNTNGLNGGIGCQLMGADSLGFGAWDNRITGGSFSGNTTHGIQLIDGSSRNVIQGVAASGNANDGIVLSGAAIMLANVITNSVFTYNGGSGVDVAGGSTSTRIADCVSEYAGCALTVAATATKTTVVNFDAANCNGLINMYSDLDITGMAGSCLANTGPGILIQVGGALVARGLNLTGANSAAPTPVKLISLANGACSCNINGAKLTLGTNDWGVACGFAGNVVHLANVEIARGSGATGTIGVLILAGVLYVDGEVLDGSHSPWYYTGGTLVRGNSFATKAIVSYATPDATALYTVPTGRRLLVEDAWWEVTADWTGGTNSAIGLSSSNALYSTKGDLQGGAGGDLAAALTAAIKHCKGTEGTKLASNGKVVLEPGNTIRFDRVVDAFTAGTGFAHVVGRFIG